MSDKHVKLSLKRRSLLQGLAAAGLNALNPISAAATEVFHFNSRTIPSSGARLPVIGMGSWITLDVGNNIAARNRSRAVVQQFFDMGGALIDSSPMYGSAQAVIGYCLEQIENSQSLFSATKIWIPGRERGIYQMEQSRKLWGVDRFDLLLVHNMVDWRSHLATLLDWKDSGRLAYTGITTSHGRRHRDMATVIREQPFDFVQFTYNIMDREAEQRLLPLAAEHGKAVIINRPFQGGALFHRVASMPLPDWAGDIDCTNWAQFFLKFIVSHPAVTCAIPATSRVDHMQENMGALTGPLPDQAMRTEMTAYFERVT